MLIFIKYESEDVISPVKSLQWLSLASVPNYNLLVKYLHKTWPCVLLTLCLLSSGVLGLVPCGLRTYCQIVRNFASQWYHVSSLKQHVYTTEISKSYKPGLFCIYLGELTVNQLPACRCCRCSRPYHVPLTLVLPVLLTSELALLTVGSLPWLFSLDHSPLDCHMTLAPFQHSNVTFSRGFPWLRNQRTTICDWFLYNINFITAA